MPTHRQKLSSTEPKRRSPRRHGAKSVFPSSSSSPNRSPVPTSNDNLKNRLVLGPSNLKTGLRSSFERRLSSGSDSGKENEVPGSMTQTLAVKDCGGSGCDDDRNKLSESDYANDEGDGGRGDDSDDSRNSVQQKDESGEVLSPTISMQAINFKKHRSVEKGKKKYRRAAAIAGKLKLSFENETAIDDDSDANSDGYSIKDDSNCNDIMNGNEEGEDGDSDSDDYDDESECSGDTVVAEDENLPNPPPPNATQEELNHYYWKLCYGADTDIERLTVEVGTWSAMRSAPAKSCLSTKKKPNCVGSSLSPSLTPRILHQSPTPNFEFSEAANLSTPDDSEESPPLNDLKNTLTINCANPRIQSAVKFGVNSAAEFDMEQPITEMTPIPITEVQRIFPSELIETEKDVEENELSRETARNTAILAEWDDDFDDIIAQDEDSDDGFGIDDEDGRRSPKSHRNHGKKGTPFKPRGRGRRSSGSARRPQKNRRASQVFSRERRNLLDDDRENDNNSCLPLSVTIDPGEYFSPSVASTPSDISTITAATTAHHQGYASSNTTIDLPLMNPRESLDSTTSAFVSPNSLRSDANSLAGSDSCATNTTVTSGKETPKSARRSSSNVLREVHASGALLPINSPQGVSTGRLRPNHLKYSPRSSIESSESSYSTKSDYFGEIGCQPISGDAFSIGNRLARILHIRVSDLANILEVTEEDDFIQDYICGKTNTAAALEMVVNGKRTESIFTGNSQWLQTAFFNHNNNADETGCVRNRFETMLRDNIAEAFDKPQSAESREKNLLPLNGNVVTIHECLQDCLKSSCIEWSKIELAIANSASCELQASLKENESKASECKEVVRSGCSQLIEISRKAFKEMSTARVSISSKTVKNAKCRRKRKILSQITEESRTIRSMEGELALEVERLSRAKRAKTMFEDYLKLGSCLHIDRPFESVRIHWYDGLHVLLLDNNVDIIFILNDENDIIVKTNCFFNDHDGVTMKLLKTFLLGTSDGCHEGSPGGFPIRKSISSIFLARESFREQLIEAFQLLFRIENFAKCIRLLNEVFVCCISMDGDKNVVLSVSAEPKEGEMIQINFSFENLLAENWNFTTVPSEVKVEIVSTKEEFHEREKRLTSATKRMMPSSIVSDPFLLKRVCDFVMEEI